MMAVLAAVAVAAKRLNIAPSILLVVAGIGMALIPGLPKIALAPELVLLVFLPPLIYSAGVAMSWREFKFNLRPIALLAFGCVHLHHLRGGGRRALSARLSTGRSASCSAPSSRRPTPWRRSTIARGSACRAGWSSSSKAKASPTTPPRSSSTASPWSPSRPARSRPAKAAGTFALIVIGEIIYGIAVGWLSPAPAAMGARAARRDHAVADDALSRLLGAGTSRRLGRARHRRLRPLRELERAAPDPVGHAAAGHLLLGSHRLSDRRSRLPAHRPAGAHLDRADPRLSRSAIWRSPPRWTTLIVIVARFVWVFPATYLPRWLMPRSLPARSVAAVAISVPAVVHRHSRRRLARRGAGAALLRRQRRGLSRTAT